MAGDERGRVPNRAANVGKRLEQIAAARGMSAREMVTALVNDEPVFEAGDAAALAELEAIWAEVEAGTEPTIRHDDVRKWLLTWGTGAYKPWSDQH